MAKASESKRILRSWKEVPSFASEDEEAEFWAKHALGKELLDSMRPVPKSVLPPPRPRTRPLAVRFDDYTIGRIKSLAARRHKGYQTLLKEFVTERLYEEEKREGVL